MWTRSYSKFYPGIRKQDAWRVMCDVDRWSDWHGDLDYCRLEGEFAVGSSFILKPKGARPVRIELLDIAFEESFTDLTRFPGARMYDTHRVEEKDGGVLLSNELVVKGPLKWLWIWLVARDVANSVPEETDSLVRVLRGDDVR